jgi:hypothetical protein
MLYKFNYLVLLYFSTNILSLINRSIYLFFQIAISYLTVIHWSYIQNLKSFTINYYHIPLTDITEISISPNCSRLHSFIKLHLHWKILDSVIYHNEPVHDPHPARVFSEGHTL